MNSKRGIIGGIIATFVATVAILLILLVFILGSGVIKSITGHDEGVVVATENDVGLGDVFYYLQTYAFLMNEKVKFRLAGQSFEEESSNG